MSNLDGDVEYTSRELKANFNALLYLLTENMAVSLEILRKLNDKELMSAEEVDDVLKVTGNKDSLSNVYNEVFTRFVGYYQAVQQAINQETVSNPPVVENTIDEEGNIGVKEEVTVASVKEQGTTVTINQE